MVNKGKIPYKKIGSKLIFDLGEIDEWVENGGRTIKQENIPSLFNKNIKKY